MAGFWDAAIDGNLNDVVAVEKEVIEKATTSGIRHAASLAQNALRRQVVSAKFGPGVEKAWRKNDYPPNGASMTAASLVYTKAKRIIEAFSADRVIVGRNGMLLIPTDFAIARGLDKSMELSNGSRPRRMMTGRILEQRVGKTWVLKSPKTGQLLLMAKIDGQAKALAFIVPQVRLRRRFDVAGVRDKFQGQLPLYIVRAIERAERPKKPGSVRVVVED
jgi:hypothetical protein